jgi:hypothetical protein
MISKLPAAAGLIGMGLSLAACSSMSCGADEQKLAQLKPGLSRADAAALMGCPGKLVGESGSSPGRFSTVEWSGPGSLLFARTYVVFLDDRLYTYSTEKRGGF